MALKKVAKIMRFLLSLLALSLLAIVAPADEDAELLEKIAASIENNYKKAGCLTVKFKREWITSAPGSNEGPNKKEENQKKADGGGEKKEGGPSKITHLVTFVVNGANSKSIAESTEGVFLDSITVKDGVSYQYVAPKEEGKKGDGWKRALSQMAGIAGDPKAWGLDGDFEGYPQFLRKRKLVSIKKPDAPAGKNGAYEICLEDAHGNRSLISFDSSMNFLPVRFVLINNEKSVGMIAKLTYKERKPGFWYPMALTLKSAFIKDRILSVDDYEKGTIRIDFWAEHSVIEFQLSDCDEITKQISSVSFPEGTVVRDAMTNAIFTVGAEEPRKPQQKPLEGPNYSMILFGLVGVGLCAMLLFMGAEWLFKKKSGA